MLIPTFLETTQLVNLPGLIKAFLVTWMIYLLRYVWKLPPYKRLTIRGHNDNQWGDSDSSDIIGLKSELLKLSNPNNFKDSFTDDTIKAQKLNMLLHETRADDILKLKEIRVKAQNELGIIINIRAFRKHLLDVFSPLRYKKQAEYANEMFRIQSDIIKCGEDLDALEHTIANAMRRIDHWNSLYDVDAKSYNAKTIRICLWGIIGSIFLCIILHTITLTLLKSNL